LWIYRNATILSRVSIENDNVQELAEADSDGSLICGLCAVPRPESDLHIAVHEHTAQCPYRRAVELIYLKDSDGIHRVK